MKYLFMMLLTLIAFSSSAQLNVKLGNVYEGKDIVYERWFTMEVAENKKTYLWCVKKNPVGCMKILRYIKTILEDNNMAFSDTFTDETLISSLVKNMEDYEMLDLTFKTGSSSISKGWTNEDMTSYVSIHMNDKHYVIIYAIPFPKL